jgi:hypothetical protein
VVFWALAVAAIDRRDTAWPAPAGSPNPAKAPAWNFGLAEVLVYADPYFAGTIHLWLLPGAALLALVCLWAAGVPVLTKPREAGWPVPGYAKVVGVSLAVGLLLAWPWVYAWVRILREPGPFLMGLP